MHCKGKYYCQILKGKYNGKGNFKNLKYHISVAGFFLGGGGRGGVNFFFFSSNPSVGSFFSLFQNVYILLLFKIIVKS